MPCDTVSASVTFIDLATASDLECFLYGGPCAITWFVASVQKSNWFATVPIQLRSTGTVDFGQKNVSATLNRSGDYVLNVWFRAQIPQLVLETEDTTACFAWTKNLMHNLFECIQLSFNELIVQEFDNYWLDFNAAFHIPANKRVGYQNMIGNVFNMTTLTSPGVPLGDGSYRSVVFPFFFGEDSGLALPVAALPFNDIKVTYRLRKWEDLLVFKGATGPADVFIFGTSTKPALNDAATWATYAVVHNDERLKMGDCPRDILIRQVQKAQLSPFKDVSSTTSFDLRFSHSIIALFFAAANVSLPGAWSNYTTEPYYAPYGRGVDPIEHATIVYENTNRVSMDADFYSLIHPYLLPDTNVPEEPGYHIYSYALLPWAPTQPSGSTNYSKLANVSISYDMSIAAMRSAGIGVTGVNAGRPVDSQGNVIQWTDAAGTLVDQVQKYVNVVLATNWNIVRVANGSLGHPVL